MDPDAPAGHPRSPPGQLGSFAFREEAEPQPSITSAGGDRPSPSAIPANVMSSGPSNTGLGLSPPTTPGRGQRSRNSQTGDSRPRTPADVGVGVGTPPRSASPAWAVGSPSDHPSASRMQSAPGATLTPVHAYEPGTEGTTLTSNLNPGRASPLPALPPAAYWGGAVGAEDAARSNAEATPIKAGAAPRWWATRNGKIVLVASALCLLAIAGLVAGLVVGLKSPSSPAPPANAPYPPMPPGVMAGPIPPEYRQSVASNVVAGLFSTTASGGTPASEADQKASATNAALQVQLLFQSGDTATLTTIYENWLALPAADPDATMPSQFGAADVNAFLANLKLLSLANLDPASTAFLGLNQFSAVPRVTLEKELLTTPAVNEADVKAEERGKIMTADTSDFDLLFGRRLITIPSYLNWNEQGKSTPVKNQGSCGSCWAFAAAAAAESAILIDHPDVSPAKLRLSTQEMVSCVTQSGGCNGGHSYHAFDFMQQYSSVDDALYPYKSQTGTCNTTMRDLPPDDPSVNKPSTRRDSYRRWPAKNNLWLRAAVTLSPVVVYLEATSTFMSYRGGILNKCDESNSYSINHAVVLVGYNYDEAVPENSYWLIRNSWGSWGALGHIKLAMTADGTAGTCNMMLYLFSPARTWDTVMAPLPRRLPFAPPPPPFPPLSANSALMLIQPRNGLFDEEVLQFPYGVEFTSLYYAKGTLTRQATMNSKIQLRINTSSTTSPQVMNIVRSGWVPPNGGTGYTTTSAEYCVTVVPSVAGAEPQIGDVIMTTQEIEGAYAATSVPCSSARSAYQQWRLELVCGGDSWGVVYALRFYNQWSGDFDLCMGYNYDDLRTELMACDLTGATDAVNMGFLTYDAAFASTGATAIPGALFVHNTCPAPPSPPSPPPKPPTPPSPPPTPPFGVSGCVYGAYGGGYGGYGGYGGGYGGYGGMYGGYGDCGGMYPPPPAYGAYPRPPYGAYPRPDGRRMRML
ncbi:hypothetical protein FOA52_002237 [Chlamydomonas sp. UWO 241]|nr:hypothetical protein FOA52_002237 [Chlamydomonas sp. UWO 241]